MKCIGIAVSALTLLAAAGCVAVSAKDINTGIRYQAVAGANDKVFVVDTEKCVAWPVQMLDAPPPRDTEECHKTGS